MATIDLKTQDLEATLQKPGILIIDCWAPWCAPCRMFTPIFERVSAKHPDVTFAKVNVDEEPAISQAFGVQGIPTLVMFRDGVPLLEKAGLMPEQVLEDVLEKARALDMNAIRAQLAASEKTEQPESGASK